MNLAMLRRPVLLHGQCHLTRTTTELETHLGLVRALDPLVVEANLGAVTFLKGLAQPDLVVPLRLGPQHFLDLAELLAHGTLVSTQELGLGCEGSLSLRLLLLELLEGVLLLPLVGVGLQVRSDALELGLHVCHLGHTLLALQDLAVECGDLHAAGGDLLAAGLDALHELNLVHLLKSSHGHALLLEHVLSTDASHQLLLGARKLSLTDGGLDTGGRSDLLADHEALVLVLVLVPGSQEGSVRAVALAQLSLVTLLDRLGHVLTDLEPLAHALGLSSRELLLALLVGECSRQTLVNLHGLRQLLLVGLQKSMLLLELSLGGGHVLHEKLTLATEFHAGAEASTSGARKCLSSMLLLAAEVHLKARLGLTLAKTDVNAGNLASRLALASLVRNLEGTQLQGANPQRTNELANLEATDLEVLVLLGIHHLVLLLHGVLGHDEGVFLGEQRFLLVGKPIDLEAGTSKLLVCAVELQLNLPM